MAATSDASPACAGEVVTTEIYYVTSHYRDADNRLSTDHDADEFYLNEADAELAEKPCDGMNIYECQIYTQRFLPKWVYRADELTMICVDTQTDGNKFLMIFDNAKEVES